MKKLSTSQISKPTQFKPSEYSKTGLSSDQILQLKQSFDLFDGSSTGYKFKMYFLYQHQELKSSMSINGYQHSSPTLYNIICQLSNSNTSIDFTMFLDIMTASYNNKLTKKYKKTFNLFDDQKTGFISIKNLRKLTKQLNLELNENQLQTLIEKADQDNDGLVSEEQFYTIMSK